MLDPQVTLAINLHANPGVYALLLGSGISRSAGIPTGWEIVLDLTRKVAQLHGDDCSSDPASWYRRKFGEEPDYSKLLELLSERPAERQRLLRQYFEPTDAEREEGKKMPTQAHRAIAELVREGYVKVIVTTNFDGLLEMAIESVGVTPVVISTVDAINGAPPLVHNACTIVKLHGDYRDVRIKNTISELDQYDPAVDALLDRILDEYGLIICGWSGEWDNALRIALERCPNHRFSTYWTALSGLGNRAARLAGLRRARVVTITGADDFFSGVADQVLALKDRKAENPLSVAVATALLRRYIVDESARIKLSELVRQETERARHALELGLREKYHADRMALAETLIEEYSADIEVLRALLTEGTVRGNPSQNLLLLNAIRRIARFSLGQRPVGRVQAIELWRYPAMRLVYSVGVAAMFGERFDLLRQMFEMRHPGFSARPPDVTVPLPVGVSQLAIRDGRDERRYWAVSEHMYSALREKLQNFIPEEEDYEAAFDGFEWILTLHAALAGVEGADYYSYCFPRLGRLEQYLGRWDRTSRARDYMSRILAMGTEWPPFKAGVFGTASFEEVLSASTPIVMKLSGPERGGY